MINREELVKKFNMGMSVFSCYIKLNSICNLQDINIVAESFIGDLCNILYGWDLKNANSSFSNNSGYDLISEKDRIIVQVTSTDSSEKVKHTLQMLENVMHDKPELLGYTLYFIILKTETDKALNYKGKENKGYICPNGIIFDQKENIYDFSTFVKKVDSLSEVSDVTKISSLRMFMNKNRNLFGAGELMVPVKNNIDLIIKEYADNFSTKLFRHIHKKADVTLKGVFVQPKIESSQELVSILGGFLWDERETRILFIEGDAACGKSSFISYLCYHYRQADEIGRGIFLQGNLICIRLRDLELDERDSKVEECIRKYLGFSEYGGYNDYKVEFDTHVIILDGADELSMLEGNGKRSLEDILLFVRKIFKKNKIIVTTRPQYINYEKLGIDFKFQIVQMQHFDKKMRKEWIMKYEKCGEQIPSETKEYILNLDEKKAAGVADTPLALYLIAACEMREELRENIWALYHEIFTNAIIETPYDENFYSILKHPIREKKTLLLEIVERIAFEMFRKSEKEQYYILAKDLDSIISEYNLEVSYSRWIRKCCVLCAYWKSNDKNGALEFYHNNIRDYFFSEYIYDKINNIFLMDNSENIQIFLNCMCEIMSYSEISGSTWEETFLFLHEKIRYEGKKFIHKYEKLQIEKHLASIFSGILCEGIIWKYSYRAYFYRENNYQKIKNTIFNALLLIRIWQDGLGIEMQGRKNAFAENTIDLKNIAKSNILSDWGMMFRRTISIPPYDRIISIGQHCIFKNISFDKKYMEEENFEASNFEKTSFEHSILKNTVLRACRFVDEISFAGSILVGVDFSAAVLINVNFGGAILRECFFYGTTIIKGNFNGCVIENCVFNETVMKEVDWSCTKTGNIDFDTVTCEKCCFDCINLKEHQIVKSTFTECTIKDGNFENTFIEELHVQCGSFQKSNFMRAMLMNNKWENVNFTEADFDNATICEGDLRQLECAGVVLSNVTIRKKKG